MYLKEVFLQNTGPISECHVKLPFIKDGDDERPLPVVIVGPNGSGKTIFLSYIVDALTEFAKQVFDDIVPTDGLGTPYFRVVGSSTVRSRQSYSLSLLHFNANDSDLFYSEKIGTPDMSIYSDDLKSVFSPVWNKPTKEKPKYVSVNKQTVESEMNNGVHAFFPASRHEDPDWLNPKSLKVGFDASAHRRFAGQLEKPIWVETCAEENIGWILDVFLDSSVDVEYLLKLQVREGGERILPNVDQLKIRDIENRIILRKSIRNVDDVLKIILQDSSAMFRHTFRNHSLSRLVIDLKAGQTILSPISLSAGQSQLFHLFTTIIRYGESDDLNNSINIPDITGIVVIDEIDANLHPTLQHDVLPQLIEMFPKVQFIVSSHSPLFLLGMEKRFGLDRVKILEMPEARRISSERYTEFGKAFKFYQKTEHFEEEAKRRFADGTRPLVLTEGPLDVNYIRHALDMLGKDELLNSLDIEFVGIEDDGGKTRYGGDTWLNNLRSTYEANPTLYHRPILLLYDCDTEKPSEQIEKLWVRSIQKNNENSAVPKGIENLFPIKFFDEEFEFRNEYYSRTSKDDGGHVENLDKPKFCDWICENGSVEDFEKFDRVVEIIKEFVETTKQPTP